MASTSPKKGDSDGTVEEGIKYVFLDSIKSECVRTVTTSVESIFGFIAGVPGIFPRGIYAERMSRAIQIASQSGTPVSSSGKIHGKEVKVPYMKSIYGPIPHFTDKDGFEYLRFVKFDSSIQVSIEYKGKIYQCFVCLTMSIMGGSHSIVVSLLDYYSKPKNGSRNKNLLFDIKTVGIAKMCSRLDLFDDFPEDFPNPMGANKFPTYNVETILSWFGDEMKSDPRAQIMRLYINGSVLKHKA